MAYDGSRLRWQNRNIRSTHSVIGQVVYEPEGTCGPRIQQDYQLVLIHSGSCTYRTGRTEHTLIPDKVSFLPPGHREEFIFSRTSETHHAWCTIAPNAMPRHFKPYLRKHILNVACTETLRSILAGAFQMHQPLSAHGRHTVDLLAQSLFAEFLNTATDRSSTGHSDCILKAIHHMESHYHEPECLIRTHTAAGVSRNTLINRFKAELKTSPDKFLWKIRTERGIAMLVETGLTIGEIAYRCGFKNPFHFSRLSRIHNGASPRSIREKAWSKQPLRKLP